MAKTIQHWANEAILVQDACNLSGVAHSLSQFLTWLSEEHPELYTEEKNHHPIVVMYVNKLSSLSNAESGEAFAKAYNWCEKVAKE
jgi:hypothetical protein